MRFTVFDAAGRWEPGFEAEMHVKRLYLSDAAGAAKQVVLDVKAGNPCFPAATKLVLKNASQLYLSHGMMIPAMFETTFWQWLLADPSRVEQSEMSQSELVMAMERNKDVLGAARDSEGPLCCMYAEYNSKTLLGENELRDYYSEWDGGSKFKKLLSDKKKGER